MRKIIVLIVIFTAVSLLADEIHLKDGKIIKGKIIQVTPKSIEYDPEGDIPFNILKKDNVEKIVYDNGKIVNLSDAKEESTPKLDEIYLKDGNVIRGKIIRVTQKYIEYNIEGNNSFKMFPRGQVKKIIYSDGTVVKVNDKTKLPKSKKPVANKKDNDDQKLFLELELGWNGYVGLGARLDYNLNNYFSINAGAGISAWGYRFSTGLRYYPNYPYGMAYGLGASYSTGTMGQDMDQDLETVDSNGDEDKEKVSLDLKPVTVINATFIYSWPVSGNDKFYIELGYGFPLKKERYSYTTESGNEMSKESKDFINLMHPGGIIISIGYGISI